MEHNYIEQPLHGGRGGHQETGNNGYSNSNSNSNSNNSKDNGRHIKGGRNGKQHSVMSVNSGNTRDNAINNAPTADDFDDRIVYIEPVDTVTAELGPATDQYDPTHITTSLAVVDTYVIRAGIGGTAHEPGTGKIPIPTTSTQPTTTQPPSEYSIELYKRKSKAKLGISQKG